MVRVKELKTLSIQEAMGNLATIANIDLSNPPKLGIIQHHRFVTDAEAAGPHEVLWLSAEGSEAVLEILDMTIRTIHQHLVALLESNEVDWEDLKVTRGIRSMIALVGEAARKMDEYLAFRQGKPLSTKVEDRIPYQDLFFFYQHRFSRQLKSDDENWSEDFSKNEDATLLEVFKTGLMDFETVRRDLQYELFSIRNENGDPYFKPDLLRDIKLACFEASEDVSIEDDPLLRIRTVQDRDLMATSQQILESCHQIIEDFYKIFKEIADQALAKSLSRAIMALYLAANPRNLIQNTSNKSSFQYFHDFHIYLREAMNSSEYQKNIAYPPDSKDRIPHFLMHMTHALSYSLFIRSGGVKQEIIGLLHRCMRKGEEKNKKTAIKGDTIWNQLLLDDEKFRTLLGQFPNGPLFKILDQIREEDPDLMSFDPIFQNNLPQRLFEIQEKDHVIQILRIPCPVRQEFINKVSFVGEFLGFLRFYGDRKPPNKHLLINLQDRGAWQEYARSLSMEALQKNAEFSDELIVATLSKGSDFYYQYGEFMNLDSAEAFISEFKNELSNPEEWGFFFPPKLSWKAQADFIEAALSFVHQEFFNNKTTLSRRNREDFIEIFYQLLILKWIEICEVDSISFTCKDAIDTGAAESALFFGFMKLLFSDIHSEIEYLRYLFYAPAFFIRERAIDPERFNRAVAVLERVESSILENSSIRKRLSDLYHPKFIKNLLIKL
jgi:hypothetical protein